VANGTVKPFEGDIADYGRFVLNQNSPTQQKPKREQTPRPAPSGSRGQGPLKRELVALEERMNRFQDLLRRIDQALSEASASGGEALKIADLAQRRGDLERALASAEEAWLELSEQAAAQ
jgi:ATP-binding cassette subfamily F protein 3